MVAEIQDVSPEIKKKAKDGLTKMKKIQISALPKIRKSYTEISRQKLWEYDIHVDMVNSTTIRYTGYIFSANKNIKDFYEPIASMLTRLRFKKAQFRTSKYDDDYSVYSINSANDSEL